MKIFDILKKDKVILSVLIIIFSLVFISLAIQTKSQWAQDSHWHMSLVENLASGKGYTSDGVSPHGKYPPGLALLILPFYLFLHDINLAGLLVIYLCSVLSIILTYKLSSEFLDKKIALVATILLIFHNLFIFNSVSIMTETPFMLFSIACIYFFTKSFDKHLFILPSMIFFSLATLIRYDGLFLVFPLLFYSYFRIRDLRKLIFSKIFIVSLVSALLMMFIWMFRNLVVFGSFIYSDYTRELTSFSITQFFSFVLLFFKTGYIFPVISLAGIIFYLFYYRKNARANTLFVWFISYVILHSIWSARAFRFYGEIILVLCIFAAIGIIKLSEFISSSKFRKIFVISLIFLIILEQLFIFYSGSINYETSMSTLNRYESIHQLSDWAKANLPANATYAVPDVAVYSIYLPEKNLIYYNQGFDTLLKQNTSMIYFLTDTLHPWVTSSILTGIEKNDIAFQVQGQQNKIFVVHLKPKLIKEIDYLNKSKAELFVITNISVANS